ncbi:hypothetical protein [Actinoallomurus acaciae]|uniref:Uncharacterized protein n=1 Tax=Actinoallomurus acaciae TaxID=502577 RepID=A0ABV5YY12_9ACTN
MSTDVSSMKLAAAEHRRVVARESARARPRPASRPPRRPRRRRSRQLVAALALVIVAGFLLGLGLPIHP